jgi:hypothetical protein
MMSSGISCSHLANKDQYKKITDLFNKVYGYVEGLSRLAAQNLRYQKQKKKKPDEN